MAMRLTCDVADTYELLTQILTHTADEKRVMFLDEPGRGAAKIQAVRMRLARVRTSLRNRGRKKKYFNLRSTINPWTDESGKRWDCVIVWRTQTQRHAMTERLEDLVGNGDML